MGTEILRPQDCLMRVGQSTPSSMVIPRSRKPSPNSSYITNPNPKFYRKTEQRKQQQQQQQHHRYLPATTTIPVVNNGVRSNDPRNGFPSTTKSAVVTILKRGESLDNIKSKKKTENLKIKRSGSGDLSSGFWSSGSESSDSERVVRSSEVYAGNAFYLSPAPSSLPLPTFSIKKELIIDDSATKDLRRFLRLD